ncbi:MAG: glycosyltransferase [Verrucomicrobiota bacterium]
MRILLTADPFIPVPPVHYGGIERIIDGLAHEFKQAGHTVGLLAHPESQCDVHAFFSWPDITGRKPNWPQHSRTLFQAAGQFQPDILHSFSRLSYLAPLMWTPYPKIMSYQRATGRRNITLFNTLIRNLLFTGCSEYICRQGRRAGGCWKPVHNFVPLDQFDFVERVPDDAPLLFLSRIEKIKGAHTAIQIAHASGKKLILAGNRVDSPAGLHYWKNHIEPELDGEMVRYVGAVDDRQKNQLLGTACALLVPIEWDEPFGIVFAEALACGTPVISNPRGALPEIITRPELGCLTGDQKEAVNAVQHVHRFDRKACREHAMKKFSSVTISKEYLATYKKLMEA